MKSTTTFYRENLSANLADMQLLSKFNRGIRFVLLMIIANMHGLFL